jgi:AcrR family transcriptional regulator
VRGMAAPAPDPSRRNERSRQAILRAALDLCQEQGYDKASIEAIAKRAGVGKQTIYRWWPSKGSVVLEALNEEIGAETDFPDTGDIVADLRTQMTAVTQLLSHTAVRVYTGVIGAAQSDPDLARAIVDEMLEPRTAACRQRLERAREEGELRADADLDVVIEMLYGAIYYRLLLHTRPIDPEQVTTVLELAFAGLRPSPRSARDSS